MPRPSRLDRFFRHPRRMRRRRNHPRKRNAPPDERHALLLETPHPPCATSRCPRCSPAAPHRPAENLPASAGVSRAVGQNHVPLALASLPIGLGGLCQSNGSVRQRVAQLGRAGRLRRPRLVSKPKLGQFFQSGPRSARERRSISQAGERCGGNPGNARS